MAKKNPTGTEMIIAHLEDNGYGGLYAPDWECGCQLGDIAPCDENGMDCHAGYKTECDGTLEDCDPDNPCTFHIMPDQPNRVEDHD